MRLYDYWRSPACHRVRIALHLKGLAFESVPVNLRQGAQRTLDYLARNAQAMVPTLEDGTARLTQSLAIIEWLDETHPEPPLLPADALARAEVRALAQLVACDVHPLATLRVVQHLQHRHGLGERERHVWQRHWLEDGLRMLERRLAATAGRYSWGDQVTLADLCLVPQLHQARHYEVDLTPFATACRVEAACLALPAFAAARPERQPDAV